MSDFNSDLNQSLEDLKVKQLYRQRVPMTPGQGVIVYDQNQALVNFCSNDYLGLACDETLKQSQIAATQQYGVGAGASQLISGYSPIHQQLELALAEFLNRERVLVFSSGYLANLGALTSLLGRGDVVLLDRLSHASLIDGARYSGATLIRYQHLASNDLSERLVQCNKARTLIVSDGVFSMDGDEVVLPELIDVKRAHQSTLMIDDAHGLGVLGETGGGSIESQGVNTNDVDVLVGTFGKAFGTCGAFVSCRNNLAETLVQKARTLIYTTAMPAALAATTLASLQRIQQDHWRRQKLRENIEYFKTHAQALGLPLKASNTPIQPLMIGESENALQISQALRHAGILVSAIRPPTVPAHTARLRITLSCLHEKSHLDQLLEALDRAVNQSEGNRL